MSTLHLSQSGSFFRSSYEGIYRRLNGSEFRRGQGGSCLGENVASTSHSFQTNQILIKYSFTAALKMGINYDIERCTDRRRRAA